MEESVAKLIGLGTRDEFQAVVDLFEVDCEECEFGHGMATKRTGKFSKYEDALEAGIALARRHGGGDVQINKFTRVGNS